MRTPQKRQPVNDDPWLPLATAENVIILVFERTSGVSSLEPGLWWNIYQQFCGEPYPMPGLRLFVILPTS